MQLLFLEKDHITCMKVIVSYPPLCEQQRPHNVPKAEVGGGELL